MVAVVVVGEFDAGPLGQARAGHALLHADEEFFADVAAGEDADAEELLPQAAGVANADVQLALDAGDEGLRGGELLDGAFVVVQGVVLVPLGRERVGADDEGLGQERIVGAIVLVDPG